MLYDLRGRIYHKGMGHDHPRLLLTKGQDEKTEGIILKRIQKQRRRQRTSATNSIGSRAVIFIGMPNSRWYYFIKDINNLLYVGGKHGSDWGKT